jgi:DNA-binding CsgD family transcriptional regulator
MKLKKLFKNNLKDKYNTMVKILKQTGQWNVNTRITGRKKQIYLNISFINMSMIFKGAIHILVIVKDVTGLKETENELRSSYDEINVKNRELHENISALKDIIIQTEFEKRRIQNTVSENLMKNVIPMLKKLKMICGDDKNKTAYIESIETGLMNIDSSSLEHYVSDYEKLSPREIEICNMIKRNLSNKEISALLHISILTVERHRHNIRKKLGLAKKKMNLHSYLNQK